MKSTIRLSKRSRRGVAVVIGIVTLVTLYPRVMRAFLPDEPIEVSYVSIETDRLEMEQHTTALKKKAGWKRKEKLFRTPPAKFDPNNYTASDWVRLGLSDKQAAVVVRFCKRGVYSNEELQQIYVLPEELFELIRDSTQFPEKQIAEKRNSSTPEFKKEIHYKPVEINTASYDELLNLPGIGPYFAEKIIQRRTALGGFVKKEQLMEIWKFDAAKLSSLGGKIEVNTAHLELININQASTEELQKHPYISWNVANSIVKMRSNVQKYSNFEQLLRSDLIDEELLRKIQPYLTL